MTTSIRSVLILSAMVCLGSLFVAQRHLGLVRAQPPLTSQLEYRVDNTVRERGIVESANSIDVRCEVPGTSTILHLIPEGSRVEKGDLLVELDGAALTEQLAGAEVRVVQARAQVLQSRGELDSTQGDGEAAIQFAEMALEAASASREKVLADGGELAYELTVTQSELTIANARLGTVEKLMEKGPEDRGSKSLEELQLAQIEAREAIRVAEARKALLEKHERASKTAMLDLAVAERQLLLTREKHAFEQARRTAEAELSASEAALAREQRNLDQIKQRLERCKISAPQAGMVVYATANATRANQGSVLAEGAQVRERQTLIQLPDLNHLQLKVHVNETRIARVRVGQPAIIRVDAFPTREFQGKVVHVNNVPEPTSWLNADVKEYAVLVSIESPTSGLRVGLTALAEIDTETQRRQ